MDDVKRRGNGRQQIQRVDLGMGVVRGYRPDDKLVAKEQWDALSELLNTLWQDERKDVDARGASRTRWGDAKLEALRAESSLYTVSNQPHYAGWQA